MNNKSAVKGLLVDIGGVLLTNTWDADMRQEAARVFNYDFEKSDSRHHDVLDSFERGLLTLDEYLTYSVFYEKRPFSREEYKEMMFAQSKPFNDMIEFVSELKDSGLCVVIVSNDGREFVEYRIDKFNLKKCADIFICSCFAGVRKPAKEIYRLALDASQLKNDEVIYIEDRAPYVEAAGLLGIRGIQHKSYENTKKFLEENGVSIENRQEQHI
jgi:putative hydrolase of the HAD superfamily